MRRKSLFGKQGRAVLAFVLSLQMCISPMQTVFAAPGNESAAIPLADGWAIANQNENLVMNDDGSITITTQKGTFAAEDQLVKNALYYEVTPAESLEFTVKVKGKPTANYQYLGIAIASGVRESTKETGTFFEQAVGVTRRYHTTYKKDNMGMYGEGVTETYEETDTNDIYSPANGTEEFYLKLKKEGSNISGYYAKQYSETDAGWNRMNGDDWSVNKSTVYDNKAYLVIAAGSGGSDTPTTATFSEVRVNGNLIDFKAAEGSFYRLAVGAEKTLADLYDPVNITATPYTPEGEEITGKTVAYTYTSNNEAVATVDNDGVVTGQSYGTARITVSATIEGVTKSGSIDMSFGAFSDIQATDTITLERGRKTTVEVTTAPTNSPDKLVWSSSKEDVATVTQNGEIKALEKGTTIVTVASAINPAIKKDIVVIVNPETLVLNDNWSVLNRTDNAVLNDINSVTITTEPGMLGDQEPATAKNIFSMDVPEGDFTITARMTGGLNADYQGGFIAVYDAYNPRGAHVTAGRRHHTYWANNYGGAAAKVGMMSAGGTIGEFYGDEDDNTKDVYIRIVKEGSKFSGSYSYDGTDYKPITDLGDSSINSITHSGLNGAGVDLRVGFYASGGGQDDDNPNAPNEIPVDITFSEFTLNGVQMNIAKLAEGASEESANLLNKLSEAKQEVTNLKAQQTAIEDEKNQALADKEAAEKAAKDAEAKAKAAETKEKTAKDARDKAKEEAKVAKEAAEKAAADAEAKAKAAADVQAKLDAVNKQLAEAQKKAEEAQKALNAPKVEKGDTCVAKNIVYEITDTTALTAKVIGTNKSTIKTVTIPATIKFKGVEYKVTEIGSSAFEECKKLTKVTIGANVAKIGKKAFYKASKLKTVKVSSKSVKSVGKQAFKGVNKKIKISVPKAKKAAYKKLFAKGGVKAARVK